MRWVVFVSKIDVFRVMMNGVSDGRLELLLLAIAHYHPDGYMQSMNFLCGMVQHQLQADIPNVELDSVFALVMVSAAWMMFPAFCMT